MDPLPAIGPAPRGARLTPVPVTRQAAASLLALWHRHLPTGPHIPLAQFALVDDCGRAHAIVILARPVAQALDDGQTLEVARAATDGTPDACSRAYATARRWAIANGYARLITYTRADEPGTSLRAAGAAAVANTRYRPRDHRPGRAAGEPIAKTRWEWVLRPRNRRPLTADRAVQDPLPLAV